MPNAQSRKTMNFQENIKQICRQWKVVKLNVVKVVNRDGATTGRSKTAGQAYCFG